MSQVIHGNTSRNLVFSIAIRCCSSFSQVIFSLTDWAKNTYVLLGVPRINAVSYCLKSSVDVGATSNVNMPMITVQNSRWTNERLCMSFSPQTYFHQELVSAKTSQRQRPSTAPKLFVLLIWIYFPSEHFPLTEEKIKFPSASCRLIIVLSQKQHTIWIGTYHCNDSNVRKQN